MSRDQAEHLRIPYITTRRDLLWRQFIHKLSGFAGFQRWALALDAGHAPLKAVTTLRRPYSIMIKFLLYVP